MFRIALLPFVYPLLHALGKGQVGFFFLESGLVRIGQSIDERSFSTLVFKDGKTFARPDGADFPMRSQRDFTPQIPDDIDAEFLRQRSGRR